MVRENAGEISREQVLESGLRDSEGSGKPLEDIKEEIINILYYKNFSDCVVEEELERTKTKV